jgi:predicted HTH transcriptional regulator
MPSYIRLDNVKVSELEKTVCAFSNQRGGCLFIGVNDEGEVTGLAKELHRAFPGEDPCSGYIKVIKKTLREALNDNQCFRVERADLFGKVIIVIVVDKSAQINYLHSTSQAYIRRGATDKKMTPAEIQAQSPRNTLFG